MPANSLADSLREAQDDHLAALLRARPDLATPPPADSTVLATRAGAPGSVARACEGLDTMALAVLETLLLLDADAEPADVASVANALGTDPSEALRTLRTLALVWGTDAALSTVPAARQAIGPYPAGLGRPVPTLDDVDLAAVVAELSGAERSLLSTLAAGPPIGKTRDAGFDVPLAQANTPVQRLLARGLLLRRDTETVELPRQLGIHLRGGQVFSTAALSEPSLPTLAHGQSTVDQVAAGEALELSRHVEALLQIWTDAPPAVLRSSGLSVRDLRRTMREVGVDHQQAVLLSELVVAAGLVIDTDDGTWATTTRTDSWLASGPAARCTILATAWLGLPRLPGLAYADSPEQQGPAKGAKDKPPAPLSDQLRRPLAPATRHRVLRVLTELPAGDGIGDPEAVVALLGWRAPRRGGRLRDHMVRWILSEAARIGLVALGAASSAARVLLNGPAADETADEHRRRVTTAIAEALPAPIDYVLVQADHTVVAPGQLEPELAAEIAAVADIESAGHATVYRVSEGSLTRALDAGLTASAVHELFARSSRTPVPQSLTYLIDDAARKHGRVRGGVCACFLRSDDEALLAEIAGNPATGHLDMRRLAPTVLVSSQPLADVLDGLRGCGYAASAESPDGNVVDLRPRISTRVPQRTRTPHRVSTAHRLSDEQLGDVLARIRAGDRAAHSKHGPGVRNAPGTGDTSTTMALLAAAARESREVWIGVVDAQGTATHRVVRPLRVGSGVLDGANNERYPLHRIISAALIE